MAAGAGPVRSWVAAAPEVLRTPRTDPVDLNLELSRGSGEESNDSKNLRAGALGAVASFLVNCMQDGGT